MMGDITDLARDSIPLVIDPNWLLAAWSVDHDKAVFGIRPSAKVVSQAAVDSNMQQSASRDDIGPKKYLFLLISHLLSKSSHIHNQLQLD